MQRAAGWVNNAAEADATVARHQAEIDAITADLYGIEPPGEVENETVKTVAAQLDEDRDEESEDEADLPTTDHKPLTADLLSYTLGAAFGRWDVRYATSERHYASLPDPIDPLPVCSPGTLQNDNGLPVEPGDEPADYPLSIPWSSSAAFSTAASQTTEVVIERY